MTLENSLRSYNKKVEKVNPQYSALLGMNEKVIEHPDRKGYCYARLVDNLNELIVVFNDKVSQKFDLPVIIERRKNTWYVVGRDTERYSNYGSNTSFLPKHASQHSFNQETRTGADAVFIYPDQFMPLLVYPSGTYGAGNLLIAPYMLQRTNDFMYVGNTGTGNLLVYKPNNDNAIMGLVFLDKTSGNPGVLIASGTPMPGSYTGTSQIIPYLPFPNTNQEPLYFFRLVSGTSSIGWSNLYNARQFIGGSTTTSTGTSGGGTLPGGIDPQFQYNNTGTFGGSPRMYYDNVLGIVYLGGGGFWYNPADTDTYYLLNLMATDTDLPVVTRGVVWGSSSTTYMQQRGYRARGTRASPSAIASGDRFIGMQGIGYDGYNWSNSSHAYVALEATENFTTGSHGAGIAFEGTHRGTLNRQRVGFLDELGMNIATGSFMIGGSPHTHDYTPNSGWIELSETWTVNTQAYTNDPGAGSNITLNMTSTALFAVGDHVIVSSSAGQEIARIGALVANTSITVNALALNHTTTNPVVIAMKFTVPTDATTRFSKSMKIRYKQGGAYKYAYVRSVAATLITLIGNSDYIITNTAIPDIAYSYSSLAQDFPTSFNFISIITYLNGTTDPTSNTINSAFYRMIGGDFAVTIISTLVRGTGNRQVISYTIPMLANAVSPIPGIDTTTATGISPATACYGFTTGEIFYHRTMANNGQYWINGSFIAT